MAGHERELRLRTRIDQLLDERDETLVALEHERALTLKLRRRVSALRRSRDNWRRRARRTDEEKSALAMRRRWWGRRA